MLIRAERLQRRNARKEGEGELAENEVGDQGLLVGNSDVER